MKLPLGLLVSHLVNVALLISVGAWFGSKPDWEPIVGLIGLLVPYCLTGHALLNAMLQSPEPVVTILSVEDTRDIVGQTLLNLPEYGRDSTKISTLVATKRSRDLQVASAVVGMLRNLGILNVDGNDLVSVVSERAHAFARCIGLSLKDGISLFGDWSAAGAANPENAKMLAIVGKAEEYRGKKLGASATPSRFARSAIVLLKAKHPDGDRFLLQFSQAWDREGYYWFIGGVMDPSDNDIIDCAYRELLEELGIERPMIHSLVPLRKVEDLRISARIGALTFYEYSLFSASLDSSRTRIKELHRMQFEEVRPVSWTTHKRQNRWHTWDEMLSIPGILRHAECIVDALKAIGPDAIQYSTSIVIND
ncbi:MAG: NUDIX hydrolase [Schlesneria sp.]